jgi:hypothetical protein
VRVKAFVGVILGDIESRVSRVHAIQHDGRISNGSKNAACSP